MSRSQASAISRPPASAKPSIAAISGLALSRVEHLLEAARKAVLREGLQVHTRAEAAARAIQDSQPSAPCLRRAVRAAESRLCASARIHRVSRIGSVQGDEQHSPADFTENFVGHWGSPLLRREADAAIDAHDFGVHVIVGDELDDRSTRRCSDPSSSTYSMILRSGSNAYNSSRPIDLTAILISSASETPVDLFCLRR